MNGKENINKNISNILIIIRSIIIALFTSIILIWAFSKNKVLGKIIIIPFLICACAKLGESIFLILKKEKISIIFQYIFRTSFFIYVFGFLIYTDCYSIITKSHTLIILTIPFWLFAIHFFKLVFFKKK